MYHKDIANMLMISFRFNNNLVNKVKASQEHIQDSYNPKDIMFNFLISSKTQEDIVKFQIKL